MLCRSCAGTLNLTGSGRQSARRSVDCCSHGESLAMARLTIDLYTMHLVRGLVPDACVSCVDGSPLTIFNWGTGEPSDFLGSSENGLQLMYKLDYRWNDAYPRETVSDMNIGGTVNKYVCECESHKWLLSTLDIDRDYLYFVFHYFVLFYTLLYISYYLLLFITLCFIYLIIHLFNYLPESFVGVCTCFLSGFLWAAIFPTYQ